MSLLGAAVSEEIVARLRRGDERALEQAFRAYYAPLASFAFRYLKDSAAAEDVVQDTFAALWAARDQITIATSLRAYLYAVVRNRALNMRKPDAVVEQEELDESANDIRELHLMLGRPDELLDRRLPAQQLAAAFEALPERQAQAMMLRWRDGLSYAEIADALDISVKSLEKTDPKDTRPEKLDPALEQFLRAYRSPGEPRFDVDNAWSHFEARQGRPRVAKVIPLWRRPAFIGAAVSVLAAAVVIVALRTYTATSANVPVDLVRVVATEGRPQLITLDDGSRITLHGGSTLRYPSRGNDRDVYLDGEALFEITHDPRRAFRVHADRGLVRDIGTKFTVRAYSFEGSVQVAVTEGRISFAREAVPDQALDLDAGNAAILDSIGNLEKLPPAAVERLLGWTTGALVFDNTPLSTAAAEIRHRYGVTVVVADSALARRPVVARFHGEPVKQVVDAIVLALGAHYDLSGTTYTIRPGHR